MPSRQDVQINIPYLSRTLAETAVQLTRFRQFAAVMNRLGSRNGDTFAWAFPGSDPGLNLATRRIGAANPPLPTLGIEAQPLPVYQNQVKVSEMGWSIPYNKYDLDLTQVDYVRMIRDYLSRDVARFIDSMVERELNMTPYRYIPYNATSGVEIGPEDYCRTFQTPGIGTVNVGTPAAAIVANSGLLVPVQRRAYGYYGAVGSINNAAAAVCTIPSTNFVVLANGTGATPLTNTNQLARHTTLVAPLTNTPLMTYQHLLNMIAFAQKRGMYGSKRINGDYVLIGPPAQILNLLISVGTAFGGTPPTAPTTFAEAQNQLKLYGEEKRLDLGCGVRLVIDTQATMYEEDWYNATGAVAVYQGDAGQTRAAMVPTTFNTKLVNAATFVTAPGGAYLEVNAPYRTASWDTVAVPKSTCTSLNGLGPCYLIGEDTVREVKVIPEQVRQNAVSDYGRLTGLAWYMMGAWRNTYVTQNTGLSTNLANNLYPTYGLNDLPTYNALSKCRIIKFDFPATQGIV